ncbi:chromatin associated protein KTI12 [Aspergillus campestris IBT 28561]|uniref:Chromatin associated protein KTI12 n=1 Tax=Aspergillus campestris (strain IBT 28561) TaxID=1392248 RepID=A0A2I1DEY4_ASPC2|nr:chromatin associated protein KTI12 [Aspergillus campestris IBT 28561]PKY08434.1 chromatin associated protein KTI12 [Aspergillus campestris IBT 28561]
MPLIILTGYPCSGLTHRAHQLSTALQEAQQTLFDTGVLPPTKTPYKIHVVSTHNNSDHPRTVYDNARSEKQTRGVAYTRARRLLGRDSIVILDGMNYIKGYRYQLWCEAKALGTTCCVVHVGTPIDQCVANNEARLRRKEQQGKADGENETETQAETAHDSTDASQKQEDQEDQKQTEQGEEDPYPAALLNNLIFRYEEPSTHSRWDKPLFTVPWSDPDPPSADIWTALTGTPHPSHTPEDSNDPTTISPLAAALSNTHLSSAASIAPSTTTTRAGGSTNRLGRPKIKPHQATALPAATDSSLLYSFEKRTSSIITAIRTFTLSNPSASAALAQSSPSPSSPNYNTNNQPPE